MASKMEKTAAPRQPKAMSRRTAITYAIGLPIIAFHQYWSSAAAFVISLFGWFLALRGVVLLAAPQLIERGVDVSARMQWLVQIGFGVGVLIGLWLTYVGWIAKPDSSPENGVP